LLLWREGSWRCQRARRSASLDIESLQHNIALFAIERKSCYRDDDEQGTQQEEK
jgi:hypothetical protein